MKKIFSPSIIGLAFVSLFFLAATPAFAVTPADSGPCTGIGQKVVGSDGFTLVCNGSFWESCGFSPRPAGCPVTTQSPTSCPVNQTPVNGVCTPYLNPPGSSATSLTTNLWAGDYNDVAQVKTLQTFLNTEMSSGLPVTGFFGPMTLAATIKFQNKYSGETYARAGYQSATGFVGQYTRDLINSKLAKGTGGGGGVVTNYCRSGKDVIVDMPWPKVQTQTRIQGFGNSSIAYRIVVPKVAPSSAPTKWLLPRNVLFTSSDNPDSPSSSNKLYDYSEVEIPGNHVAGALITFSKTPCDFNHNLLTTAGFANAPSISFGVWEEAGYKLSTPGGGSYLMLHPGETIYLNVSHDTIGYGPFPLLQGMSGSITDKQFCPTTPEGGCGRLFNLRVPPVVGPGILDVKPDGTPWPKQTDPNGPGYDFGYAGGDQLTTEWWLGHPWFGCGMTYSVDNLGHATLSTTNGKFFDEPGGHGVCAGSDAVRAMIAEQRAASR